MRKRPTAARDANTPMCRNAISAKRVQAEQQFDCTHHDALLANAHQFVHEGAGPAYEMITRIAVRAICDLLSPSAPLVAQ